MDPSPARFLPNKPEYRTLLQFLNTIALSEIGSYTWFLAENHQLALRTLRSIRTAARNKYSSFLTLLTSALIELYHNDRALHARSILQLDQPLRLEDIYHTIPYRKSESTKTWRIFTHTVERLEQWPKALPLSALPRVLTLLEKIPPDYLIMLTYDQRYSHAGIRFIYALRIYAVYGPWHVQATESPIVSHEDW